MLFSTADAKSRITQRDRHLKVLRDSNLVVIPEIHDTIGVSPKYPDIVIYSLVRQVENFRPILPGDVNSLRRLNTVLSKYLDWVTKSEEPTKPIETLFKMDLFKVDQYCLS
jgi:hypothetical protein